MASLAREIALEIQPLEQVLTVHGVEPWEFERIRQNPRFQQLLVEGLAIWNSSVNTPERIRLKQMQIVEQALPEMYARLHDPKESLSAKVELFKALSRGAMPEKQAEVGGERVTITINLGADEKLSYAGAKILPSQVKDLDDKPVIEGELVPQPFLK